MHPNARTRCREAGFTLPAFGGMTLHLLGFSVSGRLSKVRHKHVGEFTFEARIYRTRSVMRGFTYSIERFLTLRQS